MPDKLKLHAENRKPIAFETMRIYPETAKIINDLVAETGITKVKLIHQLIAYAAEYAELTFKHNDNTYALVFRKENK